MKLRLVALEEELERKSGTIKYLEEKLDTMEKDLKSKSDANVKLNVKFRAEAARGVLARRDLANKETEHDRCQTDLAAAVSTIRALERELRRNQDQQQKAAAKFMCPVPGCGAYTRVRDGLPFAESSGWQSTAGHLRSSHDCWE
jgi:chromosome segregation ATPase